MNVQKWFTAASSLLQVYRSFGLGSSYAKVMKFSCLLHYSEYRTANIDFPDFPPRLLEDLYQVQMDSKPWFFFYFIFLYIISKISFDYKLGQSMEGKKDLGEFKVGFC